jgi:hypothetical protein
MDSMNYVFLITAKKAKTLECAMRWFAIKVARTYLKVEDIGAAIPDLPVAIALLIEDSSGVIPTIRKATKAPVIHVHVGTTKTRKAQGSETYFHVSDKDRFKMFSAFGDIWMTVRGKNRIKDDGRAPIHVPV